MQINPNTTIPAGPFPYLAVSEDASNREDKISKAAPGNQHLFCNICFSSSFTIISSVPFSLATACKSLPYIIFYNRFYSGVFPGDSIVKTLCFHCKGPRFDLWLGFLDSSVGKESTSNAGDPGSIPGWERSPGEGKGYPLQYSGLENSKDCIVYGVTKSQT